MDKMKNKISYTNIWEILLAMIKNALGKNLLSQCFTLNIITQSLNGSGGVSLVNSGVCCYSPVLEAKNRDGIEDLVLKFIEPLYIYFSSNNKNTINTAVSHRAISQNLKNEKIDNITKIVWFQFKL